ncbi:GNAT family N-acetyltransferase [Dictyobacter arantiisoli]|uniref:N-acetyltransferase n=1 Tax=Dictyobacter arantiisoli TaxID=2014874 RepID=A0A5A5TEP8_9CHLR|nr:GNAT family N-acetyltransferase [Dictyobacter arantiisoli]GCF09807.1 N-acetyltransferase [Dictyobacter arantiisoli]
MHYHYLDTPVTILPHQLQGFFIGWSQPPTPEKHHEVLRKSDYCILALDENNRVVGFITAITDHVLTAYVNFLEVLPEHQNQGIGVQLVQRLLEKLHGIYAVDIICDPELIPYFESIGFTRAVGVVQRNEKRQAGF